MEEVWLALTESLDCPITALPPKEHLENNDGINEGRGGKEGLVLLLAGLVTDKLHCVLCFKLVSLVCAALFCLGTCSEEGRI